jgi:hypothetical protein
MLTRSRLSLLLPAALAVLVVASVGLVTLVLGGDGSEDWKPMTVFEAIETLRPRVEGKLMEAVAQGYLVEDDRLPVAAYAQAPTDSRGQPARVNLLARIVEVTDTSIKVRSYMNRGKDRDEFFLKGEERTYTVTPRTIIERGFLKPVPLRDLKKDEIVLVGTRDGVGALRIIGYGVTDP